MHETTKCYQLESNAATRPDWWKKEVHDSLQFLQYLCFGLGLPSPRPPSPRFLPPSRRPSSPPLAVRSARSFLIWAACVALYAVSAAMSVSLRPVVVAAAMNSGGGVVEGAEADDVMVVALSSSCSAAFSLSEVWRSYKASSTFSSFLEVAVMAIALS